MHLILEYGLDNITLGEDQKQMREATLRLEQAVKLGQLVDQKLEYRLSRDLASEEERSKFVQEELLFPLRQRIQDLQQQLLVSQQGVLTSELITRPVRPFPSGKGWIASNW